MKKFLVCLPAVLFILLSVCILSCEVGLGESVDTEAPKISITYPDAKSVIKDRFVLAGECSDDRMVSSVQVTILDSSNNPVTGYELKAPVVESAKSGQVWSVEINAKNADGSYPLKDGKYTFRTIATDGAGRKSAPFERDLEIDNTICNKQSWKHRHRNVIRFCLKSRRFYCRSSLRKINGAYSL